MKRVVALSLLCVYMVASLGVTVQSHYCMGRLVGSSFQAQKPPLKCPRCGTKKKGGGCCEDKTQTLKIQSDQQTATLSFDFAPLLAGFIPAKPVEYTPSFSYFTPSDAGFPLCHAPPDIRKVALYLFKCVIVR